ncbi:phosphoglycerate dehydrogenase [uncultured Abyssibacter sp.]|uniref:phosphoglycerate dehydrogenase n=1 Tax=uncultured Abyssibacter sp. TaxID=2320202 RepID=UPI0032B1C917
MKKYKIQTLNNISAKGLDRFPLDRYEVASGLVEPDGLILRSANIHDMEIPGSLWAVGRAGAGTNNIPVTQMSAKGVAVFNAPGANANAVKELVLTGMLLASRNIIAAWDFVNSLDGDPASMNERVEAGKKQFKGFELPGRTLGVVGLGAIGVRVANVAQDLGMKVIGYDPAITVGNAWQLDAKVDQALTVEELLAKSDFVTLHVPLIEPTRGLINADRIKLMRDGATLLNFSRAPIVDEAAVLAALEEGKLHRYVCDFPTPTAKGHRGVIALPHLGASTQEAEDNCAVMVADQLRDYLETGNVRNSVNFPEAVLPLTDGAARLAVANRNVPNMVGQISTALAKRNLNIADLLNKSRGDLAYTLVDVDGELPSDLIAELKGIDGVLSVRAIEH